MAPTDLPGKSNPAAVAQAHDRTPATAPTLSVSGVAPVESLV